WVGGDDMQYSLPSGKRWVHTIEPKGSVESIRLTEVATWLRDAIDVSKHEAGTIRGTAVRRPRRKAPRGPDDAGPTHRRWPLRLVVKSKDGKFSMNWRADVLEFGPQVLVSTPPRAETIEDTEWDRLTAD